MAKQGKVSFEEFFNKKLTCESLIQCFYDLNQLEFKLYYNLVQIGKADVTLLMETVGRNDRAIVNRSLKSLMEKKLCRRKKSTQVGRRGFCYIYKAVPVGELKNRLFKTISNWYDQVTDIIKDLDTRNFQFVS